MLALSPGGDEDVAGLHVPVHEPALMGGVEGVGHLVEQGEGPAGLELSLLGEQAPQVAPLDVAHGDVEQALDLSRLVDRRDAGVVDRGGELGLPQEALTETLVPGEIGGEQLQGDLALEAQILGQVDVAHPAPAEQGLDPVAGQLGTDAGICGERHVAAA